MLNTIKCYTEEVKRLKSLGKELNLTDEEITRIIDDSFRFLEEHSPKKRRRKSQNTFKGLLRNLICLSFVLWVVYLLYTYRKVVHSYVERNVQEITYPGMKLIRKIMLPVIKTFPALTEWYDEACLVGNPYFQVPDIECWPCEGVRSILNLTLSNLQSDQYQPGVPFIVKDQTMKQVTFDDLQILYAQKKSMFDKDAPRVEEERSAFKTAEHLFSTRSFILYEYQDIHVTWKLNRLEPTRSIRSLFGIPSQPPSFVSGATPEKFVIVDGSQAPPYEIPATEGTNVFIVQGSGSRLLVLNPSPECSGTCHRVSIVLEPNHILWYNWWYWRGVSVPMTESSKLSITYIGSYY